MVIVKCQAGKPPTVTRLLLLPDEAEEPPAQYFAGALFNGDCVRLWSGWAAPFPRRGSRRRTARPIQNPGSGRSVCAASCWTDRKRSRGSLL